MYRYLIALALTFFAIHSFANTTRVFTLSSQAVLNDAYDVVEGTIESENATETSLFKEPCFISYIHFRVEKAAKAKFQSGSTVLIGIEKYNFFLPLLLGKRYIFILEKPSKYTFENCNCDLEKSKRNELFKVSSLRHGAFYIISDENVEYIVCFKSEEEPYRTLFYWTLNSNASSVREKKADGTICNTIKTNKLDLWNFLHDPNLAKDIPDRPKN